MARGVKRRDGGKDVLVGLGWTGYVMGRGWASGGNRKMARDGMGTRGGVAGWEGQRVRQGGVRVELSK